MQKRACKKLLVIGTILFLWPQCEAQQTGLGCEAANIMAGITALGVTYRVGRNLVDLALNPDNDAFSDVMLKRAVHRGWTSSDTDSVPTRASWILSDIQLRGFWPALAMGTFAAAAARSGSLPQLEMKDVIKPAACAFGTLFAIGTGSAILRSDRSVVKSVVGRHNNYNVFEWEQNLVDYGTYVCMAAVPLYTFYQRYKV